MPKLPVRRNINRIPRYDYSTPGYYFITLCTQGRIEMFGSIENNQMVLNDTGKIINSWWQEMFKKYQNISIDAYIIMPNHIHGIINIVGVDLCVDPIQNNNLSGNHNGQTHRSAPTVSGMVQWFKTMTTNEYIRHIKHNDWQPFNKRLWQRNFYDHIIRNDASLNNIRDYIIDNPATWQDDSENPNRIIRRESII